MEKHETWIGIAEEDLQAAEWSFKGNQFLWAVFMCQQCIEKAIKAVYIRKNGNEAPKKQICCRCRVVLEYLMNYRMI